MIKVMVGSPIRQQYNILLQFLTSLEALIKNNIEVAYTFVDDNNDESVKELLKSFSENNKVNVLLEEERNADYKKDGYTHYWKQDNINSVTRNKNRIIEEFIKSDYDYLFFVDSDIVLHPKTLYRLLSVDKPIVSNIFWTKWKTDGELMPQVWLYDNYSFYKKNELEPISEQESKLQKEEFLNMLKIPGTYKVGGLGACTLISRKVLELNINFSPIYNLSYWGEDRHFCIRAAAHEIELYVDTYYPSYHIYRIEDLEGVENYKKECLTRDFNIIKDQLQELIKAGIEKYEYINEEDKEGEWFRFFQEELVEELLNRRNNYIDLASRNIEKQIKIYDYNLAFNNTFTALSGTVSFMEYGYRKERSFYKEWNARVTVAAIQRGVWRITDYCKVEEIMVDDGPIIRDVKKDPKLTLSMIVKNEGGRYLKEVLEFYKEIVDEVVIIDDGSTDNTVELIKETLKDKKLHLILNHKSIFGNEWKLRKQQWEETIKTNPDWILVMDADELFEVKFKKEIKAMIKDKSVDAYTFRLYDMWNDTMYRSDKLWNAHTRFKPFLVRYQKNFEYKFNTNDLHCGRVPVNIGELPSKNSYLRIKHLGWMRECDRQAKYERYLKLDEEGSFGIKEQYESILNLNPNLEKWIE